MWISFFKDKQIGCSGKVSCYFKFSFLLRMIFGRMIHLSVLNIFLDRCKVTMENNRWVREKSITFCKIIEQFYHYFDALKYPKNASNNLNYRRICCPMIARIGRMHVVLIQLVRLRKWNQILIFTKKEYKEHLFIWTKSSINWSYYT